MGGVIVWQGRMPRHILHITRKSYAKRNASQLHRNPSSLLINCGLGTNPLGVPPGVRRVLRSFHKWEICQYPPPVAENLTGAIARYLEIAELGNNIVLGHGCIDILITLIRLLLPPGSLLSGVSPQFTDMPLQAMLGNARYHPVILKPPRFEADLEIWERVSRQRPHVLYIDRPHNPTGQVLPLEDLRMIVDGCRERGCWVIVDEAYGDYLTTGESAINIDSPNCIVTRSFSKAWGLAGMRVGYGVIRDPELLQIFKILQPPFSISLPGIEAALAALEDNDFLTETKKYVLGAKKAIINRLEGKTCIEIAHTHPSTPIMMLRHRRGNFFEILAQAGIDTEPGSGYLDMDDSSVRLRVPPPEDLERTLAILSGIS